MSFHINLDEVETPKMFVQSAIRHEIVEALKKVEYMENRYEQKQMSVDVRKKNYRWAIGVRVGVVFAFVILALIFRILAHPAFGLFAIALCYILAVVQVFDLLRVIAAYCTHMEIFSAPVWMIKSKMKQITGYATIVDKHKLYTLQQEGRDCIQLSKQLHENKKLLEGLLKKENLTEEEGRDLLDVIVPTLVDDDTHAVLLYGERIL